jgi:hypothetical protein
MKGSSKRKNAQRAKNAFDRVLILTAEPPVWNGKGTKIEVEFPDSVRACGCDICRSKRLDVEEVRVFEVWTDEGRFISDQASQACEYASALDRPVRVRTKRIPRVQFEAIKRSAL